MKKIFLNFYKIIFGLIIISHCFANAENIETHKQIDFVGPLPKKINWLIHRFNNSEKKGHKNLLLLYGPPGNGKSTIARKIAKLTNSEFLELAAPQIVDPYVGSGPQKIVKLFDLADDYFLDDQKVVIFIDEIDALASNTKAEFRAEHKLTLQQLWLELDKLKDYPNIFVIFATNHFELLDKAFIDRFGGNAVEIKYPELEMRQKILEHYFSKADIKIEPALIIKLAEKTNDLSIRSLEDLVTDLQLTVETSNNITINEQLVFNALQQIKEKFDKNITDIKPQDHIKTVARYLNIVSQTFSIIWYGHNIYKNVLGF